MDFGIAGVAAITVICYLAGQLVKASGLDNKWIPIICGVVGGILGVLACNRFGGRAIWTAAVPMAVLLVHFIRADLTTEKDKLGTLPHGH